MDIVLHDLRHALRGLRRNWFFAAITVITLGLGIGVTTALFAVVNAVVLHPIVTDHDRVVRIWRDDVERGRMHTPVSYGEFNAWREQSRSLSAIAAIQYVDASEVPLTIGGEPTAVKLVPVSANFFDVLHGGRPALGRWLQASDELPGAPIAAVVSHRFLQRVSGGVATLLEQPLAWTGRQHSIVVVGVAPAEFEYPLGTDLWVAVPPFFSAGGGPGPAGSGGQFDTTNRTLTHFDLLGRLAPGVSTEQARAELTTLHQRFAQQFPNEVRTLPIVVEPVLDTVVGNTRQIVWFLFAAAGLVFVIAGVNVAALLLMRASATRSELAVRMALGASQARLARQTLTESLVLGTLGAISGLALARVFLGVTQWLAPGDVPRIEDAVVDGRALAFCAAAAFAWVIAFGTMPVWGHRALSVAPGALPLAQSFRGVRGTRGLRIFTVAQIAAAVIVAIGAGLLLRSFAHLQRIDRGFDAANLAVIRVHTPQSRYPDVRARLALHERLMPQIAALPGVIAATPIHIGPGSGEIGLSAPMYFEGQSEAEWKTNPWATWEPVLPSYFETMQIPITRGRPFTDGDTATTAPVAIVSEAIAARYWPGQDPIGKRVQFVRNSKNFPMVTVVGVARDHRYRELTKGWMTVYFPGAQFFFFQPGTIVVRTAGNPEALLPAIRQTIRTQEPLVAFESMNTMQTLLARELSRPLTAMLVALIFAVMAIALASIGVYGVMAYDVRQRRRELAVRSALGASPSAIFRSVVWRSLTLGALGAAIGLAVAFATTRSLSALLFEVTPADPATFAVGAAVLLAIVLLASWLPARRAAGGDPVAVLRTE